VAAKKSKKNKAKKTAGPSLQLGKDIWPLERDVFFRPDRFKYVRKLLKPEGCVFCRAAENPLVFDTLCVYQTKASMVVLNKFPYNSGHLLVLPRRHCGDLLALSQEEYADLGDVVRKTVQAMKDLYNPAGFNLGLNLGAVSGAGIPDHLHYHLVPRWAGDLNFFPLIAETKVVIEPLQVTFDRLLEYFKTHEL
jgi:ATP adenylyltransferase